MGINCLFAAALAALVSAGDKDAPARVVDDAPGQGFTYAGTWKHQQGQPQSHGGTLSTSGRKGDTAEMDFEGKIVELYVKLSDRGGTALVTVDGGDVEMIDTYAAAETWGVCRYRKELGSSGPHRLRVEVLGGHARRAKGTAIEIDRVRFEPGSAETGKPVVSQTKDSGYRGIWFTLGQMLPYGDKYSGGLGTYTANHVPIAIYAKAVDKTFFVYGGAKEGKRYLLDMVSCYDHARGVVPRPTIVHDKQGVCDPHDNPSLAIDSQGHLWVFVSGRARARPGFIYRSTRPYSTDQFERISQREITYPQPHWIEGEGFLHLFTKYTGVRELYWSTSPDGRRWSPDRKFAGVEGHYQTSNQRGKRVFTAFNMHPGGKPDRRTNLYFLQTEDLGRTWHNVRGEPVAVPLTTPHNPALVRDYRAEGRMVYIHDLDLDRQGRPVILYITSASFEPGPASDPRWWTIAHWTGKTWEYHELTRANHNYSTGSLYIEGDLWRVIGPTERGPQPIGSGGEVAVWSSRDEGRTWKKDRDVTRGSPRNHCYVRRPVDAHADFYAFWADGNPDHFSESRLYFTNKAGDRVWQLPYDMKADFEKPVEVKF